MVSVILKPLPPIDEATIGLSLLTDLTGMLPPDIMFDFVTSGVEIGPGENQARIGILIDNSVFTQHGFTRCEVKGLPSGYHLLRAFLLLPDDDGNGWLCVKSPVAYVEAELFVERPVLPPTRGFMFGQPSLCFLTPRDSVAADKLTAVVVDFFVSNCLIGEVAPGFRIKVVVNDVVVGVLSSWTAFALTGLGDQRGKLSIQLLLVNPAGEDVLFPPFSCEAHDVIVTS